MKMSKKYKRLCLTFGLGTALCATVINAANYTKTLNATYRNIGVTYNGTAKTLSAEPFLVDGSTYVPLRAVSEIMGADVNWNGTTNTVTITNNSGDTTSLQQQLASANYQVTTLQRELETVKAELETYKKSGSSSSSSTSGTDITTAELDATEDYLHTNLYDDLHEDIAINFELTKKSSRLEVTLSYTSSSEERKYNDLKQREIQNYIEDVCEAIATRHSGIEIQGVIEYAKTGAEKASFTYSKTGRLTVDFGLDEYDVEDIIYHTYTKLTLPGAGSTNISSVDASISSSNSTITFVIHVNSSADTLKDSWNKNYTTDQYLITKEFRTIRDAIQEETDFDITGELYTSDNKLLGQYDGASNKLQLKSL